LSSDADRDFTIDGVRKMVKQLKIEKARIEIESLRGSQKDKAKIISKKELAEYIAKEYGLK
jgi:hypothetical protein